MKDVATGLVSGLILILSGAYVAYQAAFNSRLSERNVEWLQGTPGMLIGLIVIAFGVGIIIVCAAKIVIKQNRYDRF